MFPQMLERARALVDGALVSTLEEIGAALKLMAERNRIIAEGAGAASVAPRSRVAREAERSFASFQAATSTSTS